jgi:hypothetical protein
MTVPSKWTAFFLSAVVPGTGQLAARSWSCLTWFAATAVVLAAFSLANQVLQGSGWLAALQVIVGLGLCLASAEHAKRLLEARRRRHENIVTSARVHCAGGSGRQVRADIQLTVARSAEDLWEIVRDLPTFLTIDPFHETVTLMRDRPAVGVDVVLAHNAFGRRFLRFGRIVAWRERFGYALSDLSARGPRIGFPHVFTIQVEPLEEALRGAPPTSQLTIRVRGRWTSRWVPTWIGRWWIELVCHEHCRLLRKGL